MSVADGTPPTFTVTLEPGTDAATADMIGQAISLLRGVRSVAPAYPQEGNLMYGMTLAGAEKELIRHALYACNGVRARAAGMLGMGERTLYRKLGEYGWLNGAGE